MGILRKLAGESAIYGLSTILGRLINYTLVPIYTAIFEPSAFGVYSVLYAYSAFFIVIFSFGMETAYFRFSSKGEDERQVFNQVFTFIFLISLALGGLIFLFSDTISNWINYPNNGLEIRLLAGILIADALAAIPFAKLRNEGKALWFASLKIINISLNVGLNIFFFYCITGLPLIADFFGFNGPDISIIFIVNLIANATTLLMLFSIWSKWRPSLNMQLMRSLIIYAFPVMLMGIAGMANDMLDKILLKAWLPTNFYSDLTPDAAVGVYSAAAKLAIFMTLMIQAFRFASEPFFFQNSHKEKAPDDYALVMKWFVIVGVFAFLAISVNLDLLKYFLRDEAYWVGLKVVPALLIAKLLLGVYFNLSIWFKVTDKTYFGTYFSFIGAGITLLSNFILIPIYGFMGCAYAAIIAFSMMILLCYYFGQKHFRIPYNISNAFSYFVLGALLVLINQLWQPNNLWLLIAYSNALVLIYLIFIFIKEFGAKLRVV